jgi:hypothetical protein
MRADAGGPLRGVENVIRRPCTKPGVEHHAVSIVVAIGAAVGTGGTVCLGRRAYSAISISKIAPSGSSEIFDAIGPRMRIDRALSTAARF